MTARSTAKITSQHSLIYRHLIETRGIDQAQHYAEANRSGARQICDWVVELGIACDLKSKAAYAYASDPARRDEIAAEAEAARRVGFDAEVLDRAPLPFDSAAALRFPIRPSSILQNTSSDWHWRWKRQVAAFSRTRGSRRSIEAAAGG